jgi:sigma-B regulation protein RsbU (phosphoserine phosphatase)
MMPRMSGVEVLEAMRTEPCLAATPVIMISAATELETVVRRIELGAEDYLPKPFNPVLLRARLGTVLEKMCLAVGDVSDKGMPAALFMTRTRSLLRASAL